jgi:hypothetical protein
MKVLDKSAFSVAIASSKSAGIFTCLRGGNSTPQACPREACPREACPRENGERGTGNGEA